MEQELWVYYGSGAELVYEGLSLEQMTQILELFQKRRYSYSVNTKISLDSDDGLRLTGTYTLQFSSGCGGLDNYDDVTRYTKQCFNELEKLKKDISEKLNIG